MTTDNWINLIAAIIVGGGTLFLGIMAWRTIHQTRIIQKAEKRERLLNEILEWAIDVSKCGTDKGLPDISSIKDIKELYLFNRTFTINLMLKFEAMSGKNQYISRITSNFGKDLQRAVEALVKDLGLHVKLLDECQHVVADNVPDEVFDKLTIAVEKMGQHNPELGKSTSKVIEEATKIKTKDIGKQEENMSKEGDELAESNEPTIKDIEEHLKRQDRQMARTQWQWLFSLGVSAMAVGLTWIIATMPVTPGDFKSGLYVFFAGLLIVLLSLFYRYRKKS